MTDQLDRASELEEMDRAQALKKRMPELKAIGYCYNCNDDIHSGQLFCSTDCRDDYQREQDAKRRNGK